jgi:ApbE superfamily uncharacterized protein (UPF0280 family)
MAEYTERTYRKRVKAKDLVSFHVVVKETDLWVSADQSLEKETRDLVFNQRLQLENYISTHPEFLTTLKPYPEDPYAPAMVKEMIETTRALGVGPMASVAGAIAQYVGHGLLERTDQVIVENGGDIFLKINREATVSVFAGQSPLSGKIGVKISREKMPVGVCASSGTIGHSLSLGSTDIVCIISPSAVLADGAATALGNRIKDHKDLDKIADWAGQMQGVIGGLAIVKDKIAAWGEIELVKI